MSTHSSKKETQSTASNPGTPNEESSVISTQSTTEASFADFAFTPEIHESIRQAGFERPTPIQSACLPPALAGHDVIGVAQTGTGKTAAFALPIIQKLTGRLELGAVVLAPTRELAAQITDTFRKLGDGAGVRVATIVGGTSMDDDFAALRSWPNVLVATPGRLIDHMENGKVRFNEIEVLVVDEADRMHDMGFIPQIRRIIDAMPAQRQTLMFTATMPADVERIARKSMRNPQRIQVGQVAPAHRARQELYELGEDDKSPLLQKLIRDTAGRVLVFTRTKRAVDRLTRILRARGLPAAAIHGDLEQMHRDKSLADFRAGTSRVLIATDIAARGLDVTGVEHVINYDFPHHAEDYVHRVGRTARIDASGLASSFITRGDQRFVHSVRRLIGADKLPAPTRLEGYGAGGDAAEPVEHAKTHRGRGRRGGRGGRGGHSRHSGKGHTAATTGGN